jgi:hypothetical protein
LRATAKVWVHFPVEGPASHETGYPIRTALSVALGNSAERPVVGAALCRDLTTVRNTCRGINPLLQPCFFLSGPKLVLVSGLVRSGMARDAPPTQKCAAKVLERANSL